MTISMYAASSPVFVRMLRNLAALLDKAASHAEAKKIARDVLPGSRLFPDMFPLLRQVLIACDFAKGVSGRLAGAELPVFDDQEKSFADLRALIAKTLAFIGGLQAAQFEGSESREIVLRPGTPKERRIAGQAYLLSYGLPQFFFHVSTSYALLRHNGIEVGKRDYMGAY